MTNEHASGFFCCAGSLAILLSMRARTRCSDGMVRFQGRSMTMAF
jgi:hypothetical protein